MTAHSVVVRFPPSPTGPLHLGTVRTLLFNFLWAKHQGGKIIFRWEDTDQERSETRWEKEIEQGLAWLGLTHDQMQRQSEHRSAHQEALQSLWQAEKVFPCFSSAADRQAAGSTVWWSPDRDLDQFSAEKKMQSAQDFVWRFRTPKDQTITFQDAVRGEVVVQTDQIGDFSVARASGEALYLLANVVDDLQGGITDIIRGEDHISNTPKQILLWESLTESPRPRYAHIPLVLDAQKRKLSKRTAAPEDCVLLRDFQEQGFLPAAVINGLAFLGWHPKNTAEIFSLSELIEVFSLEGLNRASAQYDPSKMRWFNQQWLQKTPPPEQTRAWEQWLSTHAPESVKRWWKALPHRERALELIIPKISQWSEVQPELHWVLDWGPPSTDLLCHEKFGVTLSVAHSVLNDFLVAIDPLTPFSAEKIKELCLELIAQKNLKNGTFLWPLRAALSGAERSLGPFEMAEILGKTEVQRRLDLVLKSL